MASQTWPSSCSRESTWSGWRRKTSSSANSRAVRSVATPSTSTRRERRSRLMPAASTTRRLPGSDSTGCSRSRIRASSSANWNGLAM